MKSCIRLSAALLSIIAVAGCLGVYSKDGAEAATGPLQREKPAAVSMQPAVGATFDPISDEATSQYGPSFAYLAWALFLRTMAPIGGSLTFETWTEQCQLNPNAVGCPSAASLAAARAGSNGKVRILHGSARAPARKFAGGDCSAMAAGPVGGYSPPSNLTQNAIFCEEVYVSPPEASFVERLGLTTLAGQQTYGSQRNGIINLPGAAQNEFRYDLDSVEVKLDWVPATSFHNPTFPCPDPTNSLYTETIDGACFALAGVHITAKVMLNWLWATFEPDSKVTNPNRCDPRLYGACLDPWGSTSSQPYGKGRTAKQSPQLRRAMAAAHLNPAFNNYFLTGVQTQFVSSDGKPIQLGNSFVEFNQGVPPGKSSCITCHRYAYFDGKQPSREAGEDNFGRPPYGWPSIGYACNQNQNANCTPVAPHSTSQDFSWMLGLMPYSSAGATAPEGISQSTAKE